MSRNWQELPGHPGRGGYAVRRPAGASQGPTAYELPHRIWTGDLLAEECVLTYVNEVLGDVRVPTSNALQARRRRAQRKSATSLSSCAGRTGPSWVSTTLPCGPMTMVNGSAIRELPSVFDSSIAP